jgi:hypothetical protein
VQIAQPQSGAFTRLPIVLFFVGEALDELEAASTKLITREYGENSDIVFLIDLSRVIDKLCLAWHLRTATSSDVERRLDSGYNAMTSSIPNWDGRFTMPDSDWVHAVIAPLELRRMVPNLDTVKVYLDAARAAIRRLCDRIADETSDLSDTKSLAGGFAPILSNVCLAWHLRYLAPDEANSVPQATIDEVAHCVPPWQWLQMRLIAADASADAQ